MKGTLMKKTSSLTIESGAIRAVGAALLKNGIEGKKVLYVSDPTVDALYGETVRPQIEAVGRLKTEMIEENTIRYAMAMAERVIATDIECIVGVGGGRVLDVCKYAAYISKTPFLSVPTAVANDGIASPIAVLKRLDGKPKSLGCAMPSMLLLDTEVIGKSPLALTRAGIGDTISNYMALMDWRFACERGKDEMNGYAYLMSQSALDALLKTQYDTVCPAFIEVLANALVLSGVAMDFAGSSRPVSGAEHLFSHALDYYAPKTNLHGIQVALGTIAVLSLIGEECGHLLAYLRRFGVDVHPKRLGIDEGTFVLCMQNAVSMRSNRYTHLNEAPTDEKTLKRLYARLCELLD